MGKDARLGVLKARFVKNLNCHQGLEWADVQASLEVNEAMLWSLSEMKGTGGEPDVVGLDQKTEEYPFFDGSPKSPKDRRSLCYDRKALGDRKENKPASSAMDLAEPFSIIPTTCLSSCITTVRTLTTPPEDFVGH